MTLEEINFIAQTIAAFAVVGSLIYLAIQTRQNTKVLRATAAWDAQHSFVAINDSISDGGRLGEITFRGSTDPGSVNDQEKYLIHYFMRSFYQRMEAQYALYRHGILDEELWELRKRYAKSLLANPLIDEIWQAERGNSMLTAAFVAEIEGAAATTVPNFAGSGPFGGRKAP